MKFSMFIHPPSPTPRNTTRRPGRVDHGVTVDAQA